MGRFIVDEAALEQKAQTLASCPATAAADARVELALAAHSALLDGLGPEAQVGASVRGFLPWILLGRAEVLLYPPAQPPRRLAEAGSASPDPLVRAARRAGACRTRRLLCRDPKAWLALILLPLGLPCALLAALIGRGRAVLDTPESRLRPSPGAGSTRRQGTTQRLRALARGALALASLPLGLPGLAWLAGFSTVDRGRCPATHLNRAWLHKGWYLRAPSAHTRLEALLDGP